MRSRLAGLVLRAARWSAVGTAPRTGVLVGAPHTSNWDFAMMLLIMWRGGVTPRVLIEKELFRGPLAWLLPRLGGLPLDRDHPGAVVRQLVREARSGEPFLLGTCQKGPAGASLSPAKRVEVRTTHCAQVLGVGLKNGR
jgi:1-acyl-sn-glycerol-3-phosphate acyltransferase